MPEIEYGATIVPEAEPVKEGYTFSGWSEIPETMPAHYVVVTGSFTINSYKLVYIVDDVEYKSYSLEYGSTITPEEDPAKVGYTFSGWSEIPETMPAHDVAVIGSFAINYYTLTYLVDGSEYKSYSIEYGATIIPEAEPSKTGHTFSGWIDLPETMPDYDVIVTGVFTVNKYTITYIIDNEIYMTETVDYGSVIAPPSPVNKDGFDFAWGNYPETMPDHDITIEGHYVSGIQSILADNRVIGIYDTRGKRLNALQKGVNMIMYKDGSSKKIFVR